MPPKPELKWTQPANNDLLMIVDGISDDSPTAAHNLINEIEAKAAALPDQPKLYRPGRMKGTRELVVRPNHVLIYRITDTTIDVLRVLHARQNWPSGPQSS
ncbi:MAG: type II toxin-antitoxin system RelE/ParE family toxin [Rhodoferax sp.]|nr:type II toxin-antitoxin system RelE/ParE family toxin [Rhodoferax sp.]